MRSRSLASMERAELTRCVQGHQFAMHDLALYLDTHPTDDNALDAFLAHRKAYDEAAAEYRKRFGALTVQCIGKEDGWAAWSNTVWPWEKEAN